MVSTQRFAVFFLALLVNAAGLTACKTTSSDAPAPSEEALSPSVSEAPALVVDGVYTDPQGRFTVPVPPNWQVVPGEDIVTLVSQESDIKIHLAGVDNPDLAEAIAQGWQRLENPPQLTIERTMQPPASAEGEETLVHHYETVDDYIVQAVGRGTEEMSYVLLIEGELSAIQRRGAQVQIIISGFDLTESQRPDLSEAEAKFIGDEEIAELRSMVEEAVESFGVHGLSVGVVQGDELRWAEGFGIRAVGDEDPVTPQTLMMIGSTTKTMTTLMMATLVEEGIIDWDTPVRDVLPEFSLADEELSQSITIENLVCACTGVPRKDLEFLFNAQDLSAEDIIQSLAKFETYTDFGEAFQYSNQMVAAGGYAAAAATSAEFGELFDAYQRLMNERVFEPIGMRNTTISLDEAVASDQHASPHGFYITGEYVPIDMEMERFVEPLAPAGAAWSNIDEMSLYLRTLLKGGISPDGTRLVSQASLEKLWEPQVEMSANDSYGLGWIVSDYHGQAMISHGGATLGFSSEMAFLPQADAGIVILANGAGASALTSTIRNRFLEILFDRPEQAVAHLDYMIQTLDEQFEELRDRASENLDEEKVQPYLGRYTNDALGEMELRIADGYLVADFGTLQMELALVVEEEAEQKEDQVKVMNLDPPLVGQELTLRITEEGQPQVQLGQGLAAYIYEAMP